MFKSIIDDQFINFLLTTQIVIHKEEYFLHIEMYKYLFNFSSEEESSDEESEKENTDCDDENTDKLPVDESESETKNDTHECTADLTLNNSDDTKDDSGIQTELNKLDICADKT